MDLSKILTTSHQKERFVDFFYKKNITHPRYGHLPTVSEEFFYFPRLLRTKKTYDFVSDNGSTTLI